MSNGFLSQEEIDSLLNGGGEDSAPQDEEKVELSDLEKDLLGEVGNISMGTAATALSTIVGQKVNITTPTISISTLREIRNNFETPNVVLDVQFTSGIAGGNLLIMKISDAAVIANLMMGGSGEIEIPDTLSEIEISAVQEAMNQMIGSAATSMATMFQREVNISPPESNVCDANTTPIAKHIAEDEPIVYISFRMTIGTFIDSNILQILPLETSKKIVSIMMGSEDEEEAVAPKAAEEAKPQAQPTSQPVMKAAPQPVPQPAPQPQVQQPVYNEAAAGQSMQLNRMQQPVEVKNASFQQLSPMQAEDLPKNIDLILDVPLELSVELGRTKKNIRDILALSAGSLVELNKLAEEPVDILINGKKIAYGEVVVVDESFGVKITGIVSGEERVKSLTE